MSIGAAVDTARHPGLVRRQKHLNVYPSPCMPWRAFPEQGNAAAARSTLFTGRGAAGVCGAPIKSELFRAPGSQIALKLPLRQNQSTADTAARISLGHNLKHSESIAKAGNPPVAWLVIMRMSRGSWKPAGM